VSSEGWAVESGHRAVVVDDDDDIREILAQVLRQAGVEVHCVETGAGALELVREVNPDLVTLDLFLPDMDGTDVCRAIREFSDAYIVMITSRSDEIDRLVGLELGADDYLSKPFSPREVRARALALLRRPRAGSWADSSTGSGSSAGSPAGSPDDVPVPEPQSTEVQAGGGLVLHPLRHAALLDGEALPLTPAEVDLLTALATRPGHSWSRGELVREVWRGEFIESDFLVDVHIGNIRRKLKRAGGGEWISTVDGTAYRFDPVASRG
jgi:DNA-binding response OmpR family regulator